MPKIYFADVRWTMEDVISAAAERGVTMTASEAYNWWMQNERWFRDSLTERGNEILAGVDFGKEQ